MSGEIAEIARVRQYRSEDWSAVARVWAATGLGGPQRGDNQGVVEGSLARGGTLLVIEGPDGSGIVGTCWLTDDGRRLHLHHMGVMPAWQRRGLGKRLLVEALGIARKVGRQVKLEVASDNAVAIRLYRAAGFEPLSGYEVLINRSTGAKDVPRDGTER